MEPLVGRTVSQIKNRYYQNLKGKDISKIKYKTADNKVRQGKEGKSNKFKKRKQQITSDAPLEENKVPGYDDILDESSLDIGKENENPNGHSATNKRILKAQSKRIFNETNLQKRHSHIQDLPTNLMNLMQIQQLNCCFSTKSSSPFTGKAPL